MEGIDISFLIQEDDKGNCLHSAGDGNRIGHHAILDLLFLE